MPNTSTIHLYDFYNHATFKKGVAEGMKIINNTKPGTETFLYNIGDHVTTTETSPIIIKDTDTAIIINRYQHFGYCYYVVENHYINSKGKAMTYTDTYRQRDMQLKTKDPLMSR